MRKIIPFVVALLAISCEKEALVNIPKLSESSLLTKTDIKEDLYAVTDKDIKNYLHLKQLENPELTLKNIEPFEYEGQTLLYVLNYNKGWEVISADKRTQVVLAKGEKNAFTMKDYESTPWGTWVYTLAMDVLCMKEKNPQPTYTENANYEFWGHLAGPLYLNKSPKTAAKIPPIVQPSEETGYYELSISSIRYDYDTLTVGPLLQTHWDQNRYTLIGENKAGNVYVPLKSDYSEHAPSGCTAVAGAQMAYYLHSKIGKPTVYPYFESKCTTTVNDPQSTYPTYSYFSNLLWRFFETANCSLSDMLIAHIGACAGMSYGDSGSGAYIRDLVPYFEQSGISCLHANYNAGEVYNQLVLRGMPMIISAFTSSFLGIGTGDGHSFVLDGYAYSRTKYECTYMWHWYEQYQGMAHPYVPEYTETSYHYQELTHVHINWGWGGDYDAYYSLNGDWYLNNYNLIYARKMLYDFR